MGARWYDPQVSRWLSPDTIVPSPANPQSLNRYSWVLNNPLLYIDPTGMFTEEELVEWGAYTWEELEALRGSEWYAILMEAQPGDAVYFGNGIDYYTGPMGMGTFYVSGGNLFIGGDVSLWNGDVGMYQGEKIWAEAKVWGRLFEQVHLDPGSYGLIPLPRSSDYRALSISVGIPGKPYGGAATLLWDNYGHVYLAVGAAGGYETGPFVSMNFSYGSLAGTGPTGAAEEEMGGFASGPSLNVNAGALVGLGYTRSLATGQQACEVGFYSPQVGFSVQWGFRLW